MSNASCKIFITISQTKHHYFLQFKTERMKTKLPKVLKKMIEGSKFLGLESSKFKWKTRPKNVKENQIFQATVCPEY